MSWEAIGAVGELIGAVAVLVTLLYLAMQIRQNTDQLAQSSDALTLSRRDSVTASFSRWRQMVGADSEIWIRGSEDFDSLSPAERLRFELIVEELLYAFEMLWQITLDASGRQEVFERQFGVRIVDLMKSDGARAWWSRNRQMYSHRFAAWVDQAIARDNDS